MVCEYSPHILQVRSNACTDTRLLRGGVDRDEDQVSLLDRTVDIRREEKIATACLANDMVEPWLIDWEGEISGIPSVDAGLVEVDDGNLDMRALERHNGACRATLSKKE